MMWRDRFPCEHTATIRFSGDLKLGVFVKELAEAEALCLYLSINDHDPSACHITLRFNSSESLQRFLTKHERSVHVRSKKKGPSSRNHRT
jgi:hypothetical protein